MQIGKFVAVPRPFHKLALLLGILAAPLPVFAQQTPAEPPKSEAPAAPSAAAADQTKDSTPAQKNGAAEPNAAPQKEAAPGVDEGAIKTAEVAAQVVIQTHGAASWEDGYAKINESLAKLRAAAEKAGLKVQGHPLAVFTDTDDAGFKFDAMLPVEAAPDAKPDLGADVSLTQSPSGKAIKFQHRGAYDDIDSTYDAITAYLDEKGLEARNLFVEEYVNDAKDSTDVALQVDIYVFLK
jgi:effector-binding domain-containing protein